METDNVYVAHKRDDCVQTVKEHCVSTAEMAKDFAIPPLKDVLYAIGLYHDIGKYQENFQQKIKNDLKLSVEHSTCGALAAAKTYKNTLLLLMQYCIVGHHSGIPDGSNGVDRANEDRTLLARLKRNFMDYSAYKSELVFPQIDEEKFNRYLFDGCKEISDIVEKFAFLVRYCFSCLTDADSTDTAEFCKKEHNRPLLANFENCLEKINNKLGSFVCTTQLQKARSQIQKQVYEKVNTESEIYLMNMPTGSGKTLCSMKFALERAIRTHKKRIIYVIPYNSIIDQTAAELEELFGGDAEILRHQSSFSYDVDKTADGDAVKDEEDYKNLLRHATENWNAQIIITTAVQFFESLYANKRGKLRKMHNMADSILVFDEAHLMPKEYLQPCLRAISYVTKLLGSEAVFLTATMPDFKKLIAEYSLSDSVITDLVTDTSLFEKFKKCSFENMGTLSMEALAEKTHDTPSNLIVVNSRKTARELYSLCSGNKFHLSTHMTAIDRKEKIETIKEELERLEKDFPDGKNVPDDRKITVVSTSLIEAGVDLDFHRVFREMAGLDNILQAGGRCNREGRRQGAMVYVFTLEENAFRTEKDYVNIARNMMSRYDDITSPDCIRTYYDRVFNLRKESIKQRAISLGVRKPEEIKFKEYADNFVLIDDISISVAVPRDEISRKLIDDIKTTGFASERKLQKYMCSVSRNEFEGLLEQRAVDDFGSGVWCLTNENYYNDDTGITFEGKDYFINKGGN